MTDLDMGKVEQIYGNFFAKVEGAFSCVLGHLGDKLGLYAALADGGPMTSAQLAAKTELHPRWVEEWLRQQAAAGLVSHADGQFHMDAESAAVFAHEDSALFGAGIFETVIGLLGTIDGLEESFRTGVGTPYDSYGKVTSRGIERSFKPFYRTRLTQEVFPAMEDLVPKLEAGAKVADVGCGAAAALVEMAKVYPNSTFYGFDNSRVALARADDAVREAGVANLTIHDTTHKRLEEDGSYDLITTLDCIHDMTHPAETLAAIHRSLKPDGTLFIADIRGHGSLADNLEQQPFSGMLYGFSVVCCMRAALATRDGAGLGTLGFPESVARKMTDAAGFTRFIKHDFQNPLNDYYEVRP